MLVHNDRIALGGVRGDKFIFGAIRGDKQLFDTSVITDANKEYILATYGEEALAKALVYLHSNPSFIPFFNEDPDTICSVCKIGWFRGIKTYFIALDVVPTKRTSYDFECQIETTDNTNAFFGISNDNSVGFSAVDYTYGYNPYGAFFNVNGTIVNDRGTHPKRQIPYHYEFDFKKIKFTKLDDGASGVYDTKIANDYVFTNKPITLNGLTGYNFNYQDSYGRFVVKEDGVKILHLIPYKDSAGVYYMLDLINYKKYAAKTITNQETKFYYGQAH